MSHKPGIIREFHKSVEELLKTCRDIRESIKNNKSKEIKDLIVSFNLYAQCFKKTYKEDESQLAIFHMPLYERMLTDLKETIDNYDYNSDSWICNSNLSIIYGSDRGETSGKVALKISKFYEIAKKIDSAAKKDNDNEEELDLAGDIICAVFKIFNALPCRRDLKIEGKLLEILNHYDEYEDMDSETSEDDMARTVDRTLTQMDNPELISKVSSTIGSLVKGFGIPVPPQQQQGVSTEITNDKLKKPPPHYE